MVFDRYHSGFSEYKQQQIALAEKLMQKIMDYKSIQNDMPTFVAAPSSDTDKRHSELLKLLESEKKRAAEYLAMMYIEQNCVKCLEEAFSDISSNQQTITASNKIFTTNLFNSDAAAEDQKAKQLMELFYHTSNNWSD